MNYECLNHYKKKYMEGEKENKALPKDHPHFKMRYHHAWQDVTFKCKKCGWIIIETESGLCAKCSHVKHKPLKPLKKLKKK